VKRIYVLFFFIILTIQSWGQLKFEKGYIVDNNNKKTECYIKNHEWKSPTKIEIKLSETDSSKIIRAESIKEFCIYGSFKYINRTVKIFRSNDFPGKPSDFKDSAWSTEHLMLKVLVEGKASLFYYEQGNLIRFFYSVSDTIKQLIYKKYLKENTYVYTDRSYRQQLFDDLKCSSINESSLNSLNYRYNEMVKLFRNYNDCIRYNYIDYSSITNREYFNLKITSGANVSFISIDNKYTNNTDFSENCLSLRLSIESEFFLPFYNNKISVFFEPTFSYFKKTRYFNIDTAYLKYNSIEFPIGIRYYFYLNEKYKIAVDGQFIPGYSCKFNSSLKFNRPPSFDIKDSPSFSFGAGISSKRLGFELRYYTNRKILSDYYFWTTHYTKISFIIGYKLFCSKT
jgi:hypothetical protein